MYTLLYNPYQNIMVIKVHVYNISANFLGLSIVSYEGNVVISKI